jgi:hypothetical protein
MLEILRHAAGQDDTPITAATGLRSSVENRWRDAAKDSHISTGYPIHHFRGRERPPLWCDARTAAHAQLVILTY